MKISALSKPIFHDTRARASLALADIYLQSLAIALAFCSFAGCENHIPQSGFDRVRTTVQRQGQDEVWTAYQPYLIVKKGANENISHTFSVKNESNQTLEIIESARTCGCVDYRLNGSTFAPGESLLVTVSSSITGAKSDTSGCNIIAKCGDTQKQLTFLQSITAFSDLSFENGKTHLVLSEFSAGKLISSRIAKKYLMHDEKAEPLSLVKLTADDITVTIDETAERRSVGEGIDCIDYKVTFARTAPAVSSGSSLLHLSDGTSQLEATLAWNSPSLLRVETVVCAEGKAELLLTSAKNTAFVVEAVQYRDSNDEIRPLIYTMLPSLERNSETLALTLPSSLTAAFPVQIVCNLSHDNGHSQPLVIRHMIINK